MVKFKNVSEIKGFEAFDNYLIGSDGSLINIKLNRAVKGSAHKYKLYSLVNTNKNRTSVYAHRLVALAFLDNDDTKNKTEVNHIDKNTRNNDISNLEWTTLKKNRQLRNMPSKKLKRFVIAENLETKETTLFNSLIECSKSLNINYNNLYSTINKNRTTAAGYKFYFANK